MDYFYLLFCGVLEHCICICTVLPDVQKISKRSFATCGITHRRPSTKSVRWKSYFPSHTDSCPFTGTLASDPSLYLYISRDCITFWFSLSIYLFTEFVIIFWRNPPIHIKEHHLLILCIMYSMYVPSLSEENSELLDTMYFNYM